MTGDEVAGLDFKKGRFVLFATLTVLLAPWREPTPFGRIDGTDHIAFEDDLLCLMVRIGYGEIGFQVGKDRGGP